MFTCSVSSIKKKKKSALCSELLAFIFLLLPFLLLSLFSSQSLPIKISSFIDFTVSCLSLLPAHSRSVYPLPPSPSFPASFPSKDLPRPGLCLQASHSEFWKLSHRRLTWPTSPGSRCTGKQQAASPPVFTPHLGRFLSSLQPGETDSQSSGFPEIFQGVYLFHSRNYLSSPGCQKILSV